MALRESESKFKALTERMNDMLWTTDIEMKTTYVSPSVEKVLGFTVEERMKQLVVEQVPVESLQRAALILAEELQHDEERGPDRHISLDLDLFHKDGSVKCLETSLSFIRDENGNPVGIHGLSRDITDRKRAERGLTESEEKFRKAFYTSPDSVNINRLEDGMYVSINPGFTTIMGYTEEDIIGKTSIESNVWENIADRQRLVDGLLKERQVTNLEATFRMKGGDIRHGLMSASVIDLNGVPHILSITRDITDRKRAEEELQNTLKSLREAVGTTIQVMVTAVETRDPYTAGHQLRTTDLARAIATEMGLPHQQIEGIRMAGSIHDIGKLYIPAEILSKPARLSDIEFSLVKEHSQKGYEILKNVESSWPIAEIVYQHHERMDGSGYPRNLKGDDILIEARIIAVSDVVESMASHRPYRPTLGLNAALEEIENHRGTHYDADVVDACLKLFREKGFQFSAA